MLRMLKWMNDLINELVCPVCTVEVNDLCWRLFWLCSFQLWGLAAFSAIITFSLPPLPLRRVYIIYILSELAIIQYSFFFFFFFSGSITATNFSSHTATQGKATMSSSDEVRLYRLHHSEYNLHHTAMTAHLWELDSWVVDVSYSNH